jgi:SnoaL-like domain
MNRLSGAALCLGLLLAAGCRIEDHTPTGSRRDEAAVQSLVARYARTLSERDWNGVRALFWADASYSGPLLPTAGTAHQAVPIDLALNLIARRVEGVDPERFDVRVLRSDYRQDGDLAAVWLTTRRLLPVAGSVVDGEWIEHLVLRRIGGDWRILSLAATASPRGAVREQR